MLTWQLLLIFFFFFNDTATTEIYTLSLHDALPISGSPFFAVTFVEPNIDLFATNPDGSPYRAQIPDRVANPSNPLYFLANTPITTDRTRYTGFVKARWRVNDWLAAEGNYNYDQETSA